ncbi:MAG: hypothetical protein ABGZ17_20540 [Planctomycetaceae bacterium]
MPTMRSLQTEFSFYWAQLGHAMAWQWRHMTPTKYMILLVAIFIFGWILLRHGIRQY